MLPSARRLPGAIVIWTVLAALAISTRFAPAAPPDARGRGMQVYHTPHYTLHSDLDEEQVKEIWLRANRMFREYQDRTREFSSPLNQRLPIFLYRDRQGYAAAGGIPGSGGMFDGSRLLVLAGHELGPRTWHTLQHEGFHQFARAAIGRNLPVWVNEGLAEYFGEGLFTGDGFVTGLIPPDRLKRLQARLPALRPLQEMMRMDLATWNSHLDGRNYDQAWAMVQFLAHADGGRYQPMFARFIRDVGRGHPQDQAWARSFGESIEQFETRWREYWSSLSGSPTAHLYARAAVATLTSYLARASQQGQAILTWEQFIAAAEAGQIQPRGEDWLPPALLDEALAFARAGGQWSIERLGTRPPNLICILPDGTRLAGTYTISAGRVTNVDVQVKAPGPSPRPSSRPIGG